MLYLAPVSALLGAWLAIDKLQQQDVPLGLFGLIQCLFWPFATAFYNSTAPGLIRQVALFVVAVVYFLAGVWCLWLTYKRVAGRSRAADSTTI